jgi:hypothetical protein
LATIAILEFVGASSLHAQEAAAKKKSAENLKQLALALHNYHDAMGHFPPPTIYDQKGKPLYSWRVAILPFIEEDNLYKDIDSTREPWDSDKNKKQMKRIPKLFAPVTGKAKEEGLTHYQLVVGPGAMFEDKKKIRMTDITDGTRNTIMIVEAEEAVPWMKPADLTYDPKKELPKFGGLFKDGFHAAFADGFVRFIPKDVNKDKLRAAITRAGGELLDPDELK